MNIALWIVQGLLAAVFLMAGIMKTTQPKAALAEKGMLFVEEVSPTTVRLIGGLEILGALGVVLPVLTGILPWLTPVAAVGLVLTMIGAILTHARRGEIPAIAINIVLLALAAFVVYGRFGGLA